MDQSALHDLPHGREEHTIFRKTNLGGTSGLYPAEGIGVCGGVVDPRTLAEHIRKVADRGPCGLAQAGKATVNDFG